MNKNWKNTEVQKIHLSKYTVKIMILKAFPWHALLMNMYHMRISIYISTNKKKHTYEILDHLSIYYLHVSDIILQINISDPEIYLKSWVRLTWTECPCLLVLDNFWKLKNSWRYFRPSFIRSKNTVFFSSFLKLWYEIQLLHWKMYEVLE